MAGLVVPLLEHTGTLPSRPRARGPGHQTDLPGWKILPSALCPLLPNPNPSSPLTFPSHSIYTQHMPFESRTGAVA